MSAQCIVRDDHVHARARTYIRTNTQTYAHAQNCMLNAEWSAKSTRDWLTKKKKKGTVLRPPGNYSLSAGW